LTYIAVIVLLMFAFPVAGVVIESWALHDPAPVLTLVGKWFVFFAVGVRLLLAGLRQYFEPQFTAKAIFGLEGGEALPIVRELGVANIATGVVGVLSLARPDFVLPVAIAAAIFYGLAGLGHVSRAERNAKETLAMASDLFAFAALAAYVLFAVFVAGR